MLKYNNKMGCAIMIGTSIVTSSLVHAGCSCGGMKTVEANEDGIKKALDELIEIEGDKDGNTMKALVKAISDAVANKFVGLDVSTALGTLTVKSKVNAEAFFITMNKDNKIEYGTPKNLDKKQYPKTTGIIKGTITGGKKGGVVAITVETGEAEESKTTKKPS